MSSMRLSTAPSGAHRAYVCSSRPIVACRTAPRAPRPLMGSAPAAASIASFEEDGGAAAAGADAQRIGWPTSWLEAAIGEPARPARPGGGTLRSPDLRCHPMPPSPRPQPPPASNSDCVRGARSLQAGGPSQEPGRRFLHRAGDPGPAAGAGAALRGRRGAAGAPGAAGAGVCAGALPCVARPRRVGAGGEQVGGMAAAQLWRGYAVAIHETADKGVHARSHACMHAHARAHTHTHAHTAPPHPTRRSEAVMSMFAYMALSDSDKAALAAASPAPMRGSRPLVTRRVVDAVSARLPRAPARGVELGCGSGRLCRLAAGMLPGTEIIGVDASPYMVAFANATELVPPEEVGSAAQWGANTGADSNSGSCAPAASGCAVRANGSATSWRYDPPLPCATALCVGFANHQPRLPAGRQHASQRLPSANPVAAGCWRRPRELQGGPSGGHRHRIGVL